MSAYFLPTTQAVEDELRLLLEHPERRRCEPPNFYRAIQYGDLSTAASYAAAGLRPLVDEDEPPVSGVADTEPVPTVSTYRIPKYANGLEEGDFQ